MALGEHLIGPINKRPLLIVQAGRFATQVARAVDKVLSNELADLRAKSGPRLLV
jgi:hypothetical protein